MASVEAKIETGKQKKAEADAAFKAGQVKDALRSYHFSLMYLEGINKQDLGGAMGMPAAPADPGATKQRTEACAILDEILEKIYANMAACHIKTENWQRALETADKAIAKNDANYKALFRKAKALGELGYFERAEKILDDIIKKSISDAPAAYAELARLRVIDKERERKHNKKLKGWLNRDKTGSALTPNDITSPPAPPGGSASITEVVDD
ncbi:hypothetical protein K488DRAFT_83078 [Vararia minispora EC-137]|uniref:Uncharacterized protein n=1 Tax=Vararia minispora EC-137 TaxID=1314806 RepID=A0ACB8QUZ9_9AGAM|nr:hypothetical protein K488DRAFT_83078 [Vararia minispora EC-137]